MQAVPTKKVREFVSTWMDPDPLTLRRESQSDFEKIYTVRSTSNGSDL